MNYSADVSSSPRVRVFVLLLTIFALTGKNNDSRTGALSDRSNRSFWYTYNNEWQYSTKEKLDMHKLLGTSLFLLLLCLAFLAYLFVNFRL